MNPIQVGILVAVAAVAAGLVVKWQTSKPAPQTTSVAAAPATPNAATPSASIDPAAAAQSAVDNPAGQAKPEPSPSPFGEEKTHKKAVAPKRSRPAWRQQPSTVAQNHIPQSSPPVAANPAPVAPPAQTAGSGNASGNAETSSRDSTTFGPPIPVIPPPPPPPNPPNPPAPRPHPSH